VRIAAVTARWPALLLCLTACASPAPETDPAGFDDGPTVDPLVRRHDAPLSRVWTAAVETLEEEGIVLSRRRRGTSRGVLVGNSGMGLRVKVRLHSEIGERTEASVDILPPAPALAASIQDRIGDRLSLGKAKAAVFGRTSLERAYRDELDHCMAAAELACRSLNLDVVHKHQMETRGRLEARDESGRSARFTLRSAEGPGGGTEAVVTTESTPDGGEEEFLLRVVREFERSLIPAAE
jgi:hypothetical protein